MPLTLERSPEEARLDQPRHTKAASAKSVNAAVPNIAAVALGAVFIHALDAWVLQVEGDTSLGRRALLLVVVIVAGVVSWYAGKALSERLRAIAMITTGLVSLVVVGPILSSYIDKQGLGGSRFTGVFALVGAIALTATGSTRLVRLAKSRWRKLLAIPISLVIAQFFLLPVGTAVLVTQAARPPLPARTPADVGMNYESVLIKAADGTKLAAWYIESHNGASVLMRHGSGSTRASLLEHAVFLADAGYGVLLTDSRGHGESDGRINELGWHGPQDIDAAVDYLEDRPDVTGRIGILGLSMGGEEALNAAALDERIAGVVAEGAGVSNYNDSVANGAHMVARFINWTQYAVTDLLTDGPQPVGIESSIPLIAPRPVLLITGDEAIEETMGPIYADAGGPTTRLWKLPDTPHTDGLKVHRTEYVTRVLGLFEESLLQEFAD